MPRTHRPSSFELRHPPMPEGALKVTDPFRPVPRSSPGRKDKAAPVPSELLV